MSTCRFALAVLGLSLFAPPLMAADAAEFTDLDAALAEAEKSGKPIFVYAFDSI